MLETEQNNILFIKKVTVFKENDFWILRGKLGIGRERY